ncbi:MULTISPECIES: right-handed parallel beta-helix repeat-containing protein [unclassified Solwaraspora]|uniref:right-handed parallel beta-helix repeat-containing protein n=1 Tax=unclassified Solwaraspora TaxID=2627926 RepID=UPI00259BD023|nr:family 16 glycoside hydrolase [Solwaraspora sp. WMMA2056]WJK40443.1 right-handed parallel beta-helix repeat-containing protein [Solwaraspora sp. WMMA2056]
MWHHPDRAGRRRRPRAPALAALTVTGTVLLIAGALLATGITGAWAATLFSDDFDDGDAAGWSKSGGTWTVVTDGSRVLRQSKTDAGLARMFAGSSSWTDYQVQARVKPLSWTSAGGFAGLAARSPGATSFDRLALLDGRVELQAVRSGTVTVLGAVTRPVPAGTWATLTLEVSGDTVRGWVDGTLIGTGTSQRDQGRIGVQTDRATAAFDDVTVSTVGAGPPPTPSPSVPPTSSPSASPPPTVPPTTAPPTTAPPTSGPGRELIVATTGDDANPGTLAQPLRTVQRAVDLAVPGTTIRLRGGRYAPTTNIRILTSGTADAPITLTRYRTEPVLIDGEQMPHTPAPLGGSIPNIERGAIHMQASYWRLVDLEIANGPYGVYCRTCHHNVFQRLTTRDNYESGLQIQGDATYNQVIDLDAYGNRDPRKNGESADGLAIKEGSGVGNVVRGARLWNNADDGFDAWMFRSPILIENSVAWGNGVNRWGFPDFGGDGNGFKMGGGIPDAVPHTVRNSIAFGNAVDGFIDNGNPGAHRFDRNTAWNNGRNGFTVNRSSSVLTGNLAASNPTPVSLGSSTGSVNSWNIGGTWTDASLVSTDPATITGPRRPDGAVPTSPFLHPIGQPHLGARL